MDPARLRADDEEFFDSASRDGRWCETSRNQYFKWLVNNDRRARDRMALHTVVYDDVVEFSHRTHGKKFKWVVW
jgi:hypothetical protein